MNILWLSHLVPYPPRSGVAQRSYGLLKELARRHPVTLLAFHQPALMRAMSTDPDSELTDAIGHLQSICAHVEVFEIPWDRTQLHRYALALGSLFGRHPFSVNWLRSRAYARALSRPEIRRNDIVHFDTISLGIFRSLVDWAPCVMNHHNIESHLLFRRAGKTRSRLAAAYYRQEARRLRDYERSGSADYDLHVTCSALDRERLLEIAPSANTCVIPNGVDVHFFSARPPAAPEPVFTFIGTLGWGPNRDAAEIIVDEIWPALAATWPDARLHLVGSNPPQSALDLSNRDARVDVPGFAEDVRPYMTNATFFICPIRDGGGTKLKILNAMAMGMVVIAHPIACEGIDAVPDKHVVIATTAAEYVEAARRLLGDPALCRRISLAARRLVEETYAYEVIGLDLDARYRSLVTARAEA